jgi:hypothetical protein
MKTRLALRPGQNGTKKLVAKYGARLVAVRYRYDPAYRIRLKTVELIGEQLPPGREPNAMSCSDSDTTKTSCDSRSRPLAACGCPSASYGNLPTGSRWQWG